MCARLTWTNENVSAKSSYALIRVNIYSSFESNFSSGYKLNSIMQALHLISLYIYKSYQMNPKGNEKKSPESSALSKATFCLCFP